MTNYTITYNGNCTRGKLISQNRSALIMAENANQAVIHFYVSFMNGEYFPQKDGSIQDQVGREVMAAGDDCIEFDGGRFTAIPIEE